MTLLFRLKKWYTKFLFNLSASENRLYLFFFPHFYKPKQGSLSEFLHNFSRKKSPVTFLQIGANDGFVYDPLHKFIKRDNWRGIMLEPQPDVFREYLERLHRKRPEITLLNAALELNDGKKPLYKLAISNERWATGLSSFNREVILKKVKDGSLIKHIKRQRITLPENPEDAIVSEEVMTISPETLLAKFGPGGFDLLAIDTEGFDYEILKMLDLDRISPELILYEEVNFDENTAKECRKYLESHGYTLQTIKKDVLATKISA
jgi:FkbM family methyltransferase